MSEKKANNTPCFRKSVIFHNSSGFVRLASFLFFVLGLTFHLCVAPLSCASVLCLRRLGSGLRSCSFRGSFTRLSSASGSRSCSLLWPSWTRWVLQVPLHTCLLPRWTIVCVLISLILSISDEAVFRKAPQRHQGPRVAAGCSWRSPHRDPDWRLSFLVSTSAFSKLVDPDKHQHFSPLSQLTQNGGNDLGFEGPQQ